MNRPLRSCFIAALGVWLLACGAGAADGAGREIRLEKTFTTVPGVSLRPLYIHDSAIRAEVDRLMAREKRLTEMEVMLLADLAGGLDNLARGDQEGQEQSWAEQTLFYRGVAGLAGLAGGAMGYLDGAPSLANLYQFCCQVSAEIDAAAAKRQALEAKYIDGLSGAVTGESASPADTLVTMAAQERAAVVARMRDRMLDMRQLRQNTLENLLLAIRWANASGLPTAALERTVDWATADDAQVNKLKERLGALNLKRQSLQGLIETNDNLLRRQKELADKAAKEPDSPEKAQKLAHLEERKKKLEQDRASWQASLEKTKADIKETSEAIEKAQTGVDTESKTPAVKKESGARESVGKWASTVSPRYAELAIRRWMRRRATREARHVFDLAEKLSAARRMMELAFVTQGRVTGSGGPAKALRDAYVDQGLASIAKRELQAEDAFLGQTEFFNALSSFMDQQEGRLASDDLSANVANFGADLGQGLLNLFSGMTGAFFDQCKVMMNAAAPVHVTTALDKTHQDMRKARVKTQTQIEFLLEAMKQGDDGLRPYLGLEKEPSPKPFVFEKPKAEGLETALDLFKEDKAFYDALDGGLRRIGSCLDTTLEERLATEYVISYEKACFTLRDLIRMENSIRGLDEKSGEFTFKLFLSPIKTLLAAGRFAYEWLDPVYGHRELEISVWIQRRADQVKLMEMVFPLLKKCRFSLKEIYRRKDEAKTFFGVHWQLWREHPDYRRFWHKCERERLSEQQKKLLDARAKAASWWDKEVAEERLEVIAAAAPSPRTLARAHMQDALDFMQLYNYTSALNSLVEANELDPALVSADTILKAERVMAGWQAGERAGAMLSQIGDQVIWQLITQGIVARLKMGLGFAVEPKTWAQSLGEVMTAVKGQFNPFSSYITQEAIIENGMAVALAQAAGKVASQLGQDALRDEVLINRMNMDPEVADRVAGLFWGVAEDLIKDSIKETAAFKRASLLFYARRVTELQKQAGPAGDLLATLADPNSTWFQRWRARRRVNLLLAAAKLQEHVNKLREELGEEQAAKKPPAPAKVKQLEEAETKLEEERQALTVEEVSDIFRETGVDVALSPKVIEGTDPAKRAEALEAAIKLLDRFDGRITELVKLLGNERAWGEKGKGRRKQLLEAFDIARRTLHAESFDHVAAVKDPAAAAALLKVADAVYEAAAAKAKAKGKPGPAGRKPSECLDAAGIQKLMSMIVAVAPTGSAGYIDVEGGEYRKATSDMDYTAVLQSPDGKPIDPEMRVALEFLLQASFQVVSKGRKPDDFDMSYMVDERPKFSGESLELAGPGRLAADISQADPETLARQITVLENAAKGIVADAPHGERYLSTGRIMMLVWLTSLGQDVLVFENGRLVSKKKADLVKQAQGELLDLVKSKNAKLEPWMALGIVVDDAGFLGKKLPDRAREAADSGGDREPLAAYVKELNKRSIRILLGFILSDPEGQRLLNELPERALRGEVCDHSTICDIGLKVLERMEAQRGHKLDNVRELIATSRDVKKGTADVDEIVRRQLNKQPGDPLPAPDSDEYRKAFEGYVRNTKRVVNVMTTQAIKAGAQEMKPLFESRAALQKQIDAPDFASKPAAEQAAIKERKKAVDLAIEVQLLPLAAWHKNLGGHLDEPHPAGGENPLQQAVRQALKEAGAAPDDYDKALKRVLGGAAAAPWPAWLWRLWAEADSAPALRFVAGQGARQPDRDAAWRAAA